MSSTPKAPSITLVRESTLEAIAGERRKELVCDQEEHANTEGEVQMGAARADGCRRFDEEAWGTALRCLRLLRDGVLSIVDEVRELAMRKVYRETHKRNLRPHQQVEQAQTGEYDRRVLVVSVDVDESVVAVSVDS